MFILYVFPLSACQKQARLKVLTVTLKIVILTFCYVSELIITHTSPFASLTYQFLMSSLENQRKVPKSLLNFGIALSRYLACGPAPNVQ